MESNDLTRVALVTGAARGIGCGIALRLATDGLDVAVNDVEANRDELDGVAKEIEQTGRRASAIVADVSVPEEVDEMVARLVDELGRLDVMVANAGIAQVAPLLEVPNAAGDPLTRFTMEPEAQLATMRDIQDLGMDLTGTYHSHPTTSPYPSSRDRELALYPQCAHLIVSLASPEPEVRCWSITRREFEPLDLVLDQ